MKTPQVNPPEAGKPSGYYPLFDFIPHCPVENGSCTASRLRVTGFPLRSNKRRGNSNLN